MTEILQEVPDPRIRADFVWSHIYSTTSFSTAQDAMPTAPDPRARAWYDGDNTLADGMTAFIPADQAWDIYYLFDPGRTWHDTTDTPGDPDFYMHKLGGLPTSLRLDKATFKAELLSRIPDCDP